jgi:hypothetical protein
MKRLIACLLALALPFTAHAFDVIASAANNAGGAINLTAESCPENPNPEWSWYFATDSNGRVAAVGCWTTTDTHVLLRTSEGGWYYQEARLYTLHHRD